MKRYIVGILLLLHTNHLFAACENERERASKNRELCNKWGDASVTTAAVGATVGGICFGPLGGLCGAVGIIPGGVALRICDLAKQKDEIYCQCLEGVKRAEQEALSREKEILIDRQAEAAGLFLGRLFVQKRLEYQRRALAEFDEFIDRLVDSDRDPNDPAVGEEIETERKRINSRYF